MAPTRVPITPYIVDSFVSLFRGRGDVYGSWAGGCVRQALTADKFLGHLQGDELIGVYPLLPHKGNWYCVWGCSDIDVPDLDAARNLETAFKAKDIKAWVERTRKGYHVWVFSQGLVTAKVMRRAFLAAHEAVGYPAKEVNPKQENAGNGYGNYVRLPYPNAYEGVLAERYMLDDNDQPMPLTEWLPLAMNSKTHPTVLEEIAELWKPPAKTVMQIGEASEEVHSILLRAGGIPFVMWRDGPLEGSDRSTTLFRLACRLRDAGMTPSETLKVVKSADTRWGKFHLRIDGERELVKLTERCYNITLEETP